MPDALMSAALQNTPRKYGDANQSLDRLSYSISITSSAHTPLTYDLRNGRQRDRTQDQGVGQGRDAE